MQITKLQPTGGAPVRTGRGRLALDQQAHDAASMTCAASVIMPIPGYRDDHILGATPKLAGAIPLQWSGVARCRAGGESDGRGTRGLPGAGLRLGHRRGTPGAGPIE